MSAPESPATPFTGDLVRAVLPPSVHVSAWDEIVAAGGSEAGAVAGLHPAEAELSAGYAERRRTEFAAVRVCARTALGDAGFAPAPIVKGARGAPVFPAGAVGALTHTEGLRAAAIARGADIRGVGLDAEPHGPLPDGVLRAVSLPTERAWVGALLDAEPGLRVDRLLFTAKEATYKAWFPLTRRWLGFEDAEIRFEVSDIAHGDTGPRSSGTFRSRILVDTGVVDGGAPLEELRGRWIVDAGFVVAAVTVPA